MFWTEEGKGWGIRTKETLPPRAFVFEFAEEIVTTKQMDERNAEYRARSTDLIAGYGIALDVPSTLDQTLPPEDILCIDATNSNNIASF